MVYVGFILAFIALFGISLSSVLEKALISNSLNPIVLVAAVNLISGVALCSVVCLLKFFSVGFLGNISFKHNFDRLLSNDNFLIFFLILCLICMMTRVCIFSSLKFITPFKLNVILGMMPVTVLLLSSFVRFDVISIKTVVSLILFLLAVAVQIFL